ncbi:hypothetical protein GWK08_12170 [Leptobacterium flavescens]|uniref:Uncharacterized protein n=1 Tax=Leptobacterium flavescens TaxID=472055 RepID=A0A6P0ULH3_9FLAO|nr:hypothetical protein [Leptobacterium flavescens]NER14201.1 hypothetical protein [Leptobacterium flavescens]
MSNNPQDQKFKKWLDILQQESWQLELIISGFAIYGLFMVYDPIQLANFNAEEKDNIYGAFMMRGLLISWYIITVNLIIHVVLRGLWIGAIGLRYVSGDIDYDALRYSPKFTRHLKKRVGSFDNYVATLEKYCSVIFAITFLLVFYLLGLLFTVFILVVIGTWLDQDNIDDWLKIWLGVPLIIFVSLGLIFTFIDFMTLGGLKRKKWTTFFYYPFYWVFKYTTLSFLYRPMVYNFLDTKFGRRLSFVLVPLYIGVTILAGTGFSVSNYISENQSSSSITAKSTNYEDAMGDQIQLIEDASIPSKVITENHLGVFIVYDDDLEDDVFHINDSLKPKEDKRGLHWVFTSGTVDFRTRGRLLKEYLTTIEDMYSLKIDTTDYKKEFVITTNQKDQKGFETYLDLKDLDRGKHLLVINRKSRWRDTIRYERVARIPFWYYPD